jgi:hypothetical protein
MSFDEKSGHDNAPELHEEQILAKGAPPALVPLENRGVADLMVADEHQLRNNYDIRQSVWLHF